MALSRVGAAFVVLASIGASTRIARGQDLIGELADGSVAGYFGGACTGIGDMDGDGVGDLMVGAPKHTGAAGVMTGGVSIYSGKTGQVIRGHDGEFMGNRFGSSIAVLDDIDADGVADSLVGDPDYTSSTNVITGRVYAYSGNSGALLFDLTGWNDNQSFGIMLTRTGDLDAAGD